MSVNKISDESTTKRTVSPGVNTVPGRSTHSVLSDPGGSTHNVLSESRNSKSSNVFNSNQGICLYKDLINLL